MSDLAQDIRLTVVQLKQRPGFVLGAVASLAIGMSLAIALFSVIDAALLRPLPFPEPQRLVDLYETIPEHDMSRVPPRFFTAARTSASSLQQLAAYTSAFPAVGRRVKRAA